MPYEESKIYFDGSHYIAIPHTERPAHKRHLFDRSTVKRKASVEEQKQEPYQKKLSETESTPSDLEDVPFVLEEISVDEEIFPEKPPKPPPAELILRRASIKERFEEHYRESLDMNRQLRKRYLIDRLSPYFESDEVASLYVQINLDRKLRNLIARRIRLTRKANLQKFNYFCTFTYDSRLHSEESFRKKLRNTLSNFTKRRGWKYIGVWERSPEKKRLHFHGLFHIPEGSMPGKFIQIQDYNLNTKSKQLTNQSVYFNENFGRSDFESIDTRDRMGEAVGYIMKYIEKSGERIVYSKGLPQYFISDILDEDVITTIGAEEQKLLLYDDFRCYDNGSYVGVVSPAVIRRLRTCN